VYRSTNSQYESSDILERLDVRLLEIQAGDTGWDVFSLDYKVRLHIVTPPPSTASRLSTVDCYCFVAEPILAQRYGLIKIFSCGTVLVD
jgi:hypothetical protein